MKKDCYFFFYSVPDLSSKDFLNRRVDKDAFKKDVCYERWRNPKKNSLFRKGG